MTTAQQLSTKHLLGIKYLKTEDIPLNLQDGSKLQRSIESSD